MGPPRSLIASRNVSCSTPLLYDRIRHPLYVGWATAFWVTPTMTLGHFLFAAAMTTYMAMAVRFEERDLVEHFGRRYEDYRRRVPMFVPRMFEAGSTEDTLHSDGEMEGQPSRGYAAAAGRQG